MHVDTVPHYTVHPEWRKGRSKLRQRRRAGAKPQAQAETETRSHGKAISPSRGRAPKATAGGLGKERPVLSRPADRNRRSSEAEPSNHTVGSAGTGTAKNAVQARSKPGPSPVQGGTALCPGTGDDSTVGACRYSAPGTAKRPIQAETASKRRSKIPGPGRDRDEAPLAKPSAQVGAELQRPPPVA